MINFDDLLTILAIHPTELNIPYELNKESSCSFQLTNRSDVLVGCRFSCPWGISISPELGIILPQSTCSFTATKLLLTEPPEYTQYRKNEIDIRVFVGKDGVKAEDLTNENFRRNTNFTGDVFHLPVVYSYIPAANSSSAVPEKNEKATLLDDNLIHQFTSHTDWLYGKAAKHQSTTHSDHLYGKTPESKGSECSVMRQSSNEMSSIILFSDDEIKGATNGLSDSLKIGQGGYGAVYKGNLHDTEVAIKMLDPDSQQGIDEFLQEMEVLGRIRHPNLVKLIGASIKLRSLVYEFLPHGSLGDCLKKKPRLLTWQMRTRIVYEICSALTFLHSIKPKPVVHGDLKPANILLGVNYISKLADFGLCRFISEGTTTSAFLDTKPKGTFGYIDPEFMKTGILTTSCDLYSFGVTILRLLTGMDALGIATKMRSAYKEKLLMTMVDPTAGQWPTDVSEFLAYFGLKCCAKKKSPGLMKEIAEDLKEILAHIGG